MKVGLIVMLLVLVAGLGYTLTRIWQILPFTNTIKGLLFVIPFMAIASFIIYGSGLIDKLPLNFASYLYFRHCIVCLWQHQLQEKGENAYHFNHTKAAS